MYPVKDKKKCRISLPYGWRYPNCEPYISWGVAGKTHNGVDIAGKVKKDIYYITSPIHGKVANAVGDYYQKLPPVGDPKRDKYIKSHREGNYVSINSSDSDGFRHILLHMRSVRVRPGQMVKKGQILGIMGSSGMSTGRHTHYAVKDLATGTWQDPKSYLT